MLLQLPGDLMLTDGFADSVCSTAIKRCVISLPDKFEAVITCETIPGVDAGKAYNVLEHYTRGHLLPAASIAILFALGIELVNSTFIFGLQVQNLTPV
jgi:hypothetical protein